MRSAPTRTTLLLAAAGLALVLHAASPVSVAQQEPQGAPSIHYPRLNHADVPFYPPAAWSAHFGGTVDIEVIVEGDKVVSAEVKRGNVEGATGKENEANRALLDYLSVPSIENVKTWRFKPEGRTTFVVTYSYRIQGTETPSPENPTVVLDLPRSVSVSVKPFKPTVTEH